MSISQEPGNIENGEKILEENEDKTIEIQNMTDIEVSKLYASKWTTETRINPFSHRTCIHIDKREELELETTLMELEACLKYDAECDLDCSVMTYDFQGKFGEVVFFKKYESKDGESILYLTEDKHEKIYVNLETLHPNISCLIFTVNIYSIFHWDRVKNARIRFDMLEKKTGGINNLIKSYEKKKACRYQYHPHSAEHAKANTAIVMACLYRKTPHPSAKWTIRAIGKPVDGRYAADMEQFKKAKKFIPQAALSPDASILETIRARERKRVAKQRKKLTTTREILTLRVTGRELPKKDVIGGCDPYFILLEETSDHKKNKVIARSSIIKKSRTAAWNPMEFVYSKELCEKRFILQLWDWDRATADDFIGMTIIRFNTPGTFTITNPDKKNKKQGVVDISVQRSVSNGIFPPKKFKKVDHFYDEDWKKKAMTWVKKNLE